MGKVPEYIINNIYPNRNNKNVDSVENVSDSYIHNWNESSNGDQYFEMECKCKRKGHGKSSLVTGVNIANMTSKKNIKMEYCDNCHHGISYHALPSFRFENDIGSKLQNFDFKCDKCPGMITLYMTESEAIEFAKMHHKGCDGKLSYNKLSADFVMLTWWAHHWNKLERFEDNKDLHGEDKRQSHYTISTIRDNILHEIEALIEKGQSDKRFETIFLKRRHEHCPVYHITWKGSIYGFKKELGKDNKERIYFKVDIRQEIHLPETYAGSEYRDEWYRFKG